MARNRSSTRCRATTGRSSPTCARSTPTCGRTPERSSSSWAASSPSGRNGTRRVARLAPARGARPSGLQALVRELNRVYRAKPALWETDFDSAGFQWLAPNDAADNVVAFARMPRIQAGADLRLKFVAGAALRLSRRAAVGRPLARGAQHGLDVLRRHGARETSARSRRSQSAGTASSPRRSSLCRRWASSGSFPGSSSNGHGRGLTPATARRERRNGPGGAGESRLCGSVTGGPGGGVVSAATLGVTPVPV